MKYLYGDATTFPREDNFLITLQAVIRATVALIRAARARSEQLQQASTLEAEAAQDQRALEQISKDAQQALEDHAHGVSSRVLAARSRALEALQQSLRQELARIEHELRAALNNNEVLTRRRQQALLPAMEQLLLDRDLPDTIWGCTWEAGLQRQMAPGAHAIALHPGGLEASFRVEIDPQGPWSAARRVRDVVGEVTIAMPARTGILRRRDGLIRHKLGALFIAAVDTGPKRKTLLLKSKLLEDAPGYLLSQMENGNLDINGVNNPRALGLSVAPEQQPELFTLLHQLAHDVGDLVNQRQEVTGIRFDNQNLADLSAPDELAMMLLDAVSPLTREIVRRSPSRGEICLKKDLGGRRREELYLPVDELRTLIDELPTSAHGPFRALGIFDEGEPTQKTEPNIFNDTTKPRESERVIVDLAESA
ncbi:MAG: hypothetical protein JRH20_25730 [Deltaproteobacteria bacterium]|nr:hypothetical protein [Deltaproteobacteria bacterium]